ncbi:MAG TPA: ATP-grasp domain-containing protein [Candidatus Babeliales bacterium]|nr:ATP-grasp domain-containing protein [Candidatus Babeliales bacterium]
MDKIRIGVLMGGKSLEREVSFNSGRTVCDHLDTFSFEVIPLYQNTVGKLFILPLRFLHRGKTTDFEHRLETEAKSVSWDELKELVDAMYIAQHGRYAEDGTMQGFLEILGIPYVGSKVFASALGMDKIMQKKILKASGIMVPRCVVITAHELHHELNKETILSDMKKQMITFPCVVKPAKEGSSFGVTVVHHQDDLMPAIKKAAYCDNGLIESVIIDEKINGMEFTTIIITDNEGVLVPLSVTEVVPNPALEYFDYEQKYMPGKSVLYTPARCTQEALEKIQNICCKVMRVLEFKNSARIDGILAPDGSIFIIDPNTFSGASPSSFMFKQAAERNMSHTQLINHLIETEVRACDKLNNRIDLAKRMGKMEDASQHSSEKKMRVAVLMGGASNEREISLESGRNVFYKLSPHSYDAIPVFVNRQLELFILDQKLLVSSSTGQVEKSLECAQKISWASLPEHADFVFIALHGGAGENGSVQGALEMLGLPYNGSSVLASALCMDKWKTNSFLRSEGFEVPRGLLLEKTMWENEREFIKKELQQNVGTFPYIVKPHDDGCSVMVSKVNNDDELERAVQTIFDQGKNAALIEELVTGMELTVGVLGNYSPQALPPSQAVVAGSILSIEEKFLPGAGENQTPALLPKQTLEYVQRIIEKVFSAVGCRGYARIDCFYQTAQQSATGKERVVILEINTLPGLTPATCIFHQAAELGMRPMDFINQIVQLGLQAHEEQFAAAVEKKIETPTVK